MRWWSTRPSPGDWVKVRHGRTLTVTLTDHLTGTGLRPGTRGVVLEGTGSRLVVQFDVGLGSATARVSASDVMITRRGGGTAAFAARSNRLLVVRAALACVLLAPVAQFAMAYVWATHSTSGIVAAFVEAAVLGTGDQLVALLFDPVRGLLYLLACAIMSKVAFGR